VVDGVLAVPGAVLDHPQDDPGTGEDTAHAGSGDTGAGASAAGDDSDAQGASESRDAYITRTCERILGQPPTGGLDKTTDPPAGSPVAAGDTIDVTLTWEPADWFGDELHKTIDCVTVNHSFVLGLTVEERPTANDGSFTTTYQLPVDLDAGDEVCDQGFLSGDTSGGGFGQERSNQVCFTVEAGATSAGTAPTPAPSAPAPATPTPVPADVLGEQLVAPAPAAPAALTEVAPVTAGPPVPEVLGDTLPRTGAETRRGPVLFGGIGMMLGGLALVAGNRRPRPAPAAPGSV
jgi:hypothetical protein